MSKFKNTITSTLPGVLEHNTKEAEFWRQNLQPPIIYKDLSAINSVDVRDKNLVLATASTRITLFDICGMQNKKTFSSSNDVKLYSAKFRGNSQQIFISGAGDGLVRVWDTKKSKPLRLLGQSEKSQDKRHEAAVHCVNWKDNDTFSLGDDKSIKLWDVTEDSVITEFGTKDDKPHEDYIRGSVYIDRYQSIVSGSYDHTVKVWDHRSPDVAKHNFNHGAQVESVTCRNSMIISAGDNYLTLYDMIAGKVFQKIKNVHNKTITSVYNYENYLFSASIDGYVKIYDINYVIASSISYVPSQALSCCYNGRTLAVGMLDGFVSVNQMKPQTKGQKNLQGTANGEEEFDEDFQAFDFSKGLFTENRKLDIGQNTLVVRSKLKKNKLDKHEELLKRFEHSKALSNVLKRFRESDPKMVVNFCQELIRRGALEKALAGKMDRDVRTVIQFICRHISDCRYSRILTDVALSLVNVYVGQINRSIVLQKLFKRMMVVVEKEMKSMSALAQLTGRLEMVCNAD